MDIKNAHPPKWADRFLQWYCRPDLLEEVQGDVYELYQKRLTENGYMLAKIKFIWDVLRFFRLANIKRTQNKYPSNSYIMFRSYLIVGFRNAIRHRLNSSINILGLSLALAVAITSFIFIDNQFHADNFHTNRERIYQVTNRIEVDDRIDEWSDTPVLLGPALVKDLSIVEASSRIEFSFAAVKYNEAVFNEPIWFVDPDFMNMFSFPLISGNRNALHSKNEIILSKEIAEKYFGATDPIGKSLSIKFRENEKEEFTIGAVIDRPTGSSLSPTMLFSMATFEEQNPINSSDWAYQVDATFVMLKSGRAASELVPAMDKYITIQHEASPQWLAKDFQFHSLKGLAGKNAEIISAVSNGAHPAALLSLGVISGLLLLLASFNYMNVSTATVATRLKEIGIRKVIGGQKKEIIQQFLIENLLLCTISLSIGCIIAYAFFLPWFNGLYPVNIPFSFSSGNVVFLFFGGLLVFIGLISGAYPAFYIASFTPINIMGGREKFGQRSLFSRVLLTFQFILAFMTVVASFVFIDNSMYLKNKDWGYDHADIIVVRVEEESKYLALRDQLSNNKNISGLAGSASHIGRSNTRTTFVYQEQRFEAVDFRIGYDYLETLNMKLKEGRFLDRTIQSDETESVVINETFAEKLGWKNPVGKYFELDSVRRYVVGVVKDFHYEGFYQALGPVLFRIAPEEDFNYLSVKVKSSHLSEVQQQVKAAWASVAPDDTYEGFIQDEVFHDFNRDNNANVKLLGFISVLTVVLASLGLFGLVSFNITRRMKEFSIRKVFGANVGQILKLMNGDYVWILLIAFFVGAPVGFFMMNALIQSVYPDPQAAGPLPFTLAVIIMFCTVAITVSSQIRRIVRENPSKTLKND